MTYERAVELAQKYKGFIESKFTYDGYDVSVFHYRLMGDDYFDSEPDLRELRGLSFVWYGKTPVRFWGLHKFFNVNEREETQLKELQKKKMVGLYQKEDGSMLHFIRLPNGKWIPKTKGSLFSFQVGQINTYLDDNLKLKDELYRFLEKCFDNGITPFFEWVSPFNRIVLDYKSPSIVLLQMRYMISGNYVFPIMEHPIFNRKSEIGHAVVYENSEGIFKSYQYEEFFNRIHGESDHEGYVVRFDDGMMVKIKTKWYCDKHRVRSCLLVENNLIRHSLDEELDDLLSEFDFDDPLKIWANKQSKKINDFILDEATVLFGRLSIYTCDYNCDRKQFAMTYCKEKWFHRMMSLIDIYNLKSGKVTLDDAIDVITKSVKEQTSHLEKARTWLKKNNLVVEKTLDIDG